MPGNITVGKHPLVRRFVKGVFQLRPALPRYVDTWDVNIVLNYLRGLPPADKLSLKQLTFKLTMLIALLSGQRTQLLYLLNINHITFAESHCQFYISAPLKHTRPGFHQEPVKLPAYPSDLRLCVVHTLVTYLDRTRSLRGSGTQLLISYIKPHRAVSVDTVSRWITSVLSAAGIDTKCYSAGSSRSASTSAAKRLCTPMDTILSAAGWSNCSTFAKFYDKPVNVQVFMGSAILNSQAKP